MLLLNRLQSKPSTQFTQSFVYFLAYLAAIQNVGANVVIQILEAIQPGYVSSLLSGFFVS